MNIKQQINILYRISDEKTATQISIKAACLSAIKSPSIEGTTKNSSSTSKTEARAMKISDLSVLARQLDTLEKDVKREIEEYLNKIEDSILREIMRSKYIEKLTWKDIGAAGNTKESARKLVTRYLDRHEEDVIISKENEEYFLQLKTRLKEIASSIC